MVVIGNMKTSRSLISRYKIDEVWCIVRSLKTMPYFANIPVFHVPNLSPSEELFHDYLHWRDYGMWNESTFIKEYVPRFLNEMHSLPNRKALNALWFAQKQKNILLLCYCEEERTCHRSIVAGLLQGVCFKGEKANVICQRDYSEYYTQYKAL